MFTSGSGGGSGSSSDLISFAMQEASKLFDSAGGASSGNKQDAINSAAMTVMKMVVQSKFSAATGGSNSGGLSGLMGLVSGMFCCEASRPDECAVTGLEVHVRDESIVKIAEKFLERTLGPQCNTLTLASIAVQFTYKRRLL